MENITRDIITDLWPLYMAGEASPDSRALIEAYLREDQAFAHTITGLGRERFPNLETPALAPDHELKTLARIKKRLTGPILLLQLALICALISDTSNGQETHAGRR